MKRYVLLGTVGAGKSTLYAALHGIACDEAKKTQAMQYDLDGGVDTPGEFFCHPMYYPALLSTTVDTDVLIYVHPANMLRSYASQRTRRAIPQSLSSIQWKFGTQRLLR